MITENDGKIIIMTDDEAFDLIQRLSEQLRRGLNGAKLRQFNVCVSRELKPEEKQEGSTTTHAASLVSFNILTQEQYKSY